MTIKLESILKNLDDNVDDDTTIAFTYSKGADVWHCNETHVDRALEETDVADRVGVALAQLGNQLQTSYGGNALNEVRESDLLDEYTRGDGTFDKFVAGTVREHFYHCYSDNIIEEITERFDYKRGFTTLTATFLARVPDVKNNLAIYDKVFKNWDGKITTPMGQLTFKL
jgi:hypothetical protein